MTKDEALKMAIKVLSCPSQGRGDPTLKALNACKEVLEQPFTRDWKETINERIASDSEFKEALEQKEVGDAEIRQMLNDIEYYQKRVEALEQPAQEPVAVIEHYNETPTWTVKHFTVAKRVRLLKHISEIPIGKLYTHPHQWQGLTDDDMSIIFDKFDWKEIEIAGEHLDLFKFSHTIEQALKEKNHGL